MSAGKQKHDYHLVDPSPWPIYVSFATLVLAFGAVYYFHSKGSLAFINWVCLSSLWSIYVVERCY